MSITTLLLAALLGYLLAIVLLWLFQERLIFPAYRSRRTPLERAPAGLETLFEARDGTALEGFWLKARGDRLLLWFDGNSDNVHQLLPHITHRFKNLDIAALNYRGYGKSQGRPSQEALFEDALAIYDHYSQGYRRIYLLGRSLGSGVASFLSGQRKTDGLILITPFRSIRDLARLRFPFVPLGFLVRHPFESWRYLQTGQIPVALLGVKRDRITPEAQAQALKKHIRHLIKEEWLNDTTHAAVIHHPRYFTFIEEAIEAFETHHKES